ncbi:hypothetical protein Tco_1140340 [Tanacetum coccineum]
MMLEDPYVKTALQAPPSLDYVPGPEHPPSPVYVSYVSKLEYPEYMPLEDEVFLVEEQPLPAVEDPEEEDPQEDPTDYPANGGDDDDDDDESSDDDEDDDDDDVEEDEDEEEEEHSALADSVLPPVHRITTRMSIQE